MLYILLSFAFNWIKWKGKYNKCINVTPNIRIHLTFKRAPLRIWNHVTITEKTASSVNLFLQITQQQTAHPFWHDFYNVPCFIGCFFYFHSFFFSLLLLLSYSTFSVHSFVLSFFFLSVCLFVAVHLNINTFVYWTEQTTAMAPTSSENIFLRSPHK